VAFIVGRSGRVQPDALLAVEMELQQMHENAKILFLDAPDDVLIIVSRATATPPVSGAVTRRFDRG